MTVLKELKQGYYLKEWLENIPDIQHVNEWVSKVRKVRHEYTYYATAPNSKKKYKREDEEWVYSQIIKRELKDGSFRYTYTQTNKLPRIPYKGTFRQWLPGLETVEFPENCEYLGYRLDGTKIPDTQDFQFSTLEEAIEACLIEEESRKQNLSYLDDGQRF